MTAIVEAKALSLALARLRSAVKPHKLYPALQCVRIACEAGLMTVTAFNLEQEMAIEIEAEGDLPPTLTPHDRLGDWLLGCFSRGKVSLGLNGNFLRGTAGRARATFAVMPIEQWASFSALKKGATFSASGAALAAALVAVVPAVKENIARVDLSGISIDAGGIWSKEEDVLTLCGSDGVMLAARELSSIDLKGKVKAILPKGVAQTIARLVAGLEFCDVAMDERSVAIRGGGFTYRSVLIAAEYRDWRRLVPAREPQLSYEASAFASAIALAATGSNDDGARRAVPVKLSFSDSSTTFEGRDDRSGAVSIDDCPHSSMGELPQPEISLASDQVMTLIDGLKVETLELMVSAAPVKDNFVITFTGAGVTDRIALSPSMRG